MFVEENVETTEETTDETVVDETTADDTTTESADEKSDADVIEKSLIDSDGEEGDDSDSDDGEGDADGDSDADGSEVVYEKPDISDIMGEGSEFDDELFDKMTARFKGLKASQEEVNEITREYAQHIKDAAVNHQKNLMAKYNEIKDDWRKESMEEFKTDFKKTLKSSGTAIKKFGSQELVDLLNDTGVGNHKEVIKCFAKIGKYFVEDGVVDGEASTKGSTEDVLYPSMKK